MSIDGGDVESGQERPVTGAQLLRLADFECPRPERILSEVRAYWESIRRGRAVPARADVQPHGIHRALDYAFILERVAPGAARFRLAGQHLIDLMGMEVRGMPICAVLNPSSRGRFSDVLETVFRAPQGAELTLFAKGEYARPEVNGRMLIMPLRSDLGDVTRALGCLVSEGNIGTAPRRFDLAAERMLPLLEGGEVMEPSPSAPVLARGFAERGKDFDRKGAPPKQPLPAPVDIPQTPAERRAMFRVIPDDNGAGRRA